MSAKLSVVMFWPKPTSEGEAPRKRAAVSCAASTTWSLRRLVSKGPPRFAFASRRYDVTASITESGVCVPPGPSKNAVFLCSAAKRARTAATSKATVLIAPPRR